MKKLCILNHAHAEKPDERTDYACLITNRGRAEAKVLGKSLKMEPGGTYDWIVSSPAMRAFETAMIVSEIIGIDQDHIEIKESLYSARDNQVILEIIKSLDDKHHQVLLVGHNPAITEFAKKMVAGFSQPFYTCSALQIEFNVNSWNRIEENSGVFTFYKFNRHNPDISKLDEAIARAMKKEIFSKLDESVKNVEAALAAGDSTDNLAGSKKLAKQIFKNADIITVRRLALLEEEMRKHLEAKKIKQEAKLKKIEKRLAKEDKKIQSLKSDKREKLEHKKKKLEGMLSAKDQAAGIARGGVAQASGSKKEKTGGQAKKIEMKLAGEDKKIQSIKSDKPDKPEQKKEELDAKLSDKDTDGDRG